MKGSAVNMKKFSVLFFALLCVLFVGMVSYVALSEDFTEPVSQKMSQEEYGINENSPVWNMTMDDLAKYLYDNGILDSLNYQSLSEGVATVARKYGDLELYWWDVKNLDKNSAEYKAYTEMQKDGAINLWDSGNMMRITQQGPFGIWTEKYSGDLDKLMKVFHAFGTG